MSRTAGGEAAAATGAEELSRILAQAQFIKPFGYVVESSAPGECVIRVPYTAAADRPGGVVNGIVIMGARETDIHCAARVLKLGKRTAYGTAECLSDNGDLLAHHVISYALIPAGLHGHRA